MRAAAEGKKQNEKRARETITRVSFYPDYKFSSGSLFSSLSLIWCKRQGFSMTYPPFRSQMLSITRSSKVLSENSLDVASGQSD